MIVAEMKRIYRPHGTGALITFDDFEADPLSVFCVERPWKDNEPFESCIPEGEYIAKKRDERYALAKYPDAWEVQDVDGRTSILFHAANRPHEVHGCIALNLNLKLMEYGHIIGTKSKPALQKMDSFLEGETEFKLTITS